MSEPYLGITVDLHLFGRYVSIASPNWNRAQHRPSWYPKWEFTSLEGIPCELSKVFMLDWFFHLTVMYGPPTNRAAFSDEEWDALYPEGGD